jgi:hypothetical protein
VAKIMAGERFDPKTKSHNHKPQYDGGLSAVSCRNSSSNSGCINTVTMGNEPSIATLPEPWHTILPTITRESILDYSYRHRYRRSTRKSNSSGSTTTTTDGDGGVGDTAADIEATSLQKSVYLDDDRFDLDEHVPTALAILTAYPQLKDIRFKLVPGVLKEERYWECIFGILNDHEDGYFGDDKGIDEDGVQNISETLDEYNNKVKETDMALSPLDAPSNSGKPKVLGKIGEKLLVKTPIAHLGAYTIVS